MRPRFRGMHASLRSKAPPRLNLTWLNIIILLVARLCTSENERERVGRKLERARKIERGGWIKANGKHRPNIVRDLCDRLRNRNSSYLTLSFVCRNCSCNRVSSFSRGNERNVRFILFNIRLDYSIRIHPMCLSLSSSFDL